MSVNNKFLVFLVFITVFFASTGCRTGIRRVANAIEGQGATEINYEKTNEKTLLNYLTSENSAFTARGVNLELDPKTGQYAVKVDDVRMIRTPSDNQQYFAGQFAQGRAADTEAIAGMGSIVGAAVEGAVGAAVNAVLPMYVSRQENKTQRRQIKADEDVSIAESYVPEMVAEPTAESE